MPENNVQLMEHGERKLRAAQSRSRENTLDRSEVSSVKWGLELFDRLRPIDTVGEPLI